MGNEFKAAAPNVTPIDLFPQALKKVREQARGAFGSMLGEMFDNADDALFELADKATTNDGQAVYFDAMREVRIKRPDIEQKFLKTLHNGFRNLYLPNDKLPEELLHSAHENTSLSLVPDDDLEESVAVRGMVTKASTHHEHALSLLVKRIEHLVRAKPINRFNNPIGPIRVCQAFQDACEELEIDIRPKLVVFKLFERHVLTEAGTLYDMANKSLKDMGVLPLLKADDKVSNRNLQPSSPVPGANAEDDSAPLQGADSQQGPIQKEEIFNFLRELLDDSRDQVVPATAASVPVVDDGPMLSNADLLNLLSTIQVQSQPAPNRADLPSQPLDVRQSLFNLVNQNPQPQGIGRIDDDAINLVSMLFEFILDDRQLPTPMKALLARLQIPMLKVVVLDKSFFSRGGHSARRLLNELATAAIGWNEALPTDRDPLYKKIASVVDRILHDFDSDISIFDDLLEEFTSFVSTESRRAELIEQRTRAAEEGLGKSQQARAVVGYTLNEKAVGKRLPRVVVDILRDCWSNYMFLIHVKEGINSPAWEQALQTVEDLIWSVEITPGGSERGQLLKVIPSLLQRLRVGFGSVSYSKVKMRTQLKELEVIHLRNLRSSPEEPADTPIAGDENAEASGQQARTAAPGVDKIIESPVIVENAARPEKVSETLPEDDEHAKVAASISTGAWVEFKESDDKVTRAKLAAIIKATGKYIFVNRVGMKVAEKTLARLAIELRDGTMSVLDNALLFDRALENVIGHLREMKN